jgi:hypothetical protein
MTERNRDLAKRGTGALPVTFARGGAVPRRSGNQRRFAVGRADGAPGLIRARGSPAGGGPAGDVIDGAGNSAQQTR